MSESCIGLVQIARALEAILRCSSFYKHDLCGNEKYAYFSAAAKKNYASPLLKPVKVVFLHSLVQLRRGASYFRAACSKSFTI